MKKTRRSAFTIVELVIVIAVIAILSAVLIPTFGAIIKDANVAADQTAASALTTELHIYLKGDTITSEADLVKALKDENLGFDVSKLTPKASAYGYHYWYDMENQTIVVKTAEEVAGMPKKTSNSANRSFRDVYNTGYYLIDMGGSDVVDVINQIDNLQGAADYKDLIENTIPNASGNANDSQFIKDIQNAVENTTIRNDNGNFFYEQESKHEYISPSASMVGDNHYNYDSSADADEKVTKVENAPNPTESDKVDVPSNIIHVDPNGFGYAEDNKTTVSVEDTSILVPGATNGKVENKQNGETYEIADPEKPEELVNVNPEKTDDTITLVAKLPFADFEISFDVVTEGNLSAWNDGKLYLNYAAYVGANKQFNITYGENKTVYPGTSEILVWSSNNTAVTNFTDTNGVITVVENTTAKTMEENTATITVSAINIHGETVTKEINLTVVKPTSATIGLFDLPDPDVVVWKYNGRITTKEFVLSDVVYNQNPTWTIATGTPDLKVGLENGVDPIIYSADDETITLDVANAINLFGDTGTKTHTFTVSIDGCFVEEVSLTVVDQSDTPFEPDFYFEDNTLTSEGKVNNENVKHYYRYYVGNGNSIKLSDLVKNTEAFGTATVKVFIENAAGQRLELSEVEADIDVLINGNTYAEGGVSFTSLDAVTLQFSGANNPLLEKVVVEVEPADFGAFGIEIAVVNGMNVKQDNFATYANNAEITTNLVIFSDITVSSSHKINLGGKTIYGNGFKLDAQQYVSSASDTNDYFISVNGGTVDNVYIEGPVYPVLNYDHNNDGFYVSGITMQGTSYLVNSYVSGFRQPVRNTAGTLNVHNTTLRGGNYSNLLLTDGNLNLIDVTTVQDQNGMLNTVAHGSTAVGKITVTGMGIGLERAALDSKITIIGYLDQFNWIKNGQTATLPTLSAAGKTLDVNTVFGFIFNGINDKIIGINVTADMGSVKYFINQTADMNSSSRTDGYVHAGIVFAELGSDAPNWTESVTIDEAGRTDGTIKKRNFDKLPLLFSKTGLERNGRFLFTAKDYFTTDGLVVFWSHADNRQWAAASMDYNIGWSGVTVKRLVNPTGTKVDADKPIYQIGNDDYPIVYPGYNYGN